MNRLARLLRTIHNLLLRTYPSEFRFEFEEEMQLVFADAMLDAAQRGRKSVIRMFLREVRDWLATMPAEHWSGTRDRRAALELPGRCAVDELKFDDGGGAFGLRGSLLAALPPVVFGWGIALASLFRGNPWSSVPAWSIAVSLAISLISAVVIATGAITALKRGLPDWGYTWVGSALMGVFLFTTVVDDELADSGRNIVSPTFETIILVVLLLLLLAAFGASAMRGWQRAGLLSIGLAATLGLSLLGAVMSAPFYRHDLALLAAPLGLIVGALIHVFSRKPMAVRLAALAVVALLNAALVWTTNLAWSDWFVKRNQPSMILPLVAILTAVLLAGPLFGLLARPIRPLLRRG